MSPDQARQMYRALIVRGENVILRRNNPAPAAPTNSQPFMAKMALYSEEELAGGIDQRSRKVIALADDIEASGFPLPIRRNDKLIVHGKSLNIELVDDDTRRADGGVLIAYQIQVMGA